MMGMWIKPMVTYHVVSPLTYPFNFKRYPSAPNSWSPSPIVPRKQRRSKRRRNRAGHAYFRQRALSARGARRRKRRLLSCHRSPPSVPGTSSLVALPQRDPTTAKDLIWVRRGEANKICDTLLISKAILGTNTCRVQGLIYVKILGNKYGEACSPNCISNLKTL